MKILVIDNTNMPYQNNKSSGGVETLVRIQLELLSQEHEIDFMTSYDSEECDISNVVTRRFFPYSKMSKLNDMSSLDRNKAINKFLSELLISNRYNIAINHSQSNNSIVKTLSKYDTPSITYAHNAVEVIGGIAGLEYVNVLSKYYESGGLVVNMSRTSMMAWSKYAANKEKACDPFTTYHYAYAAKNQPAFQEKKDNGIMATRISESKRIVAVVRMHEKAKKNLTLCYVFPRTVDEEEYFKKVEKEVIITSLKNDLCREELNKEIESSSYMIVAGPEGFPISPIESVLSGSFILLLSSKESHPVMELGEIIDYPKAIYRETDSLNNMPSFLDSDRIEMANKAYDFFNYEKAYVRLMEVINKAVIHKNSIVKTGFDL